MTFSIEELHNNSEYDIENDSDENSIYDEIFDNDSEFLDSEKEDGNYYLGNISIEDDNHMILSNSVSVPTFYDHPAETIQGYLYNYGVLERATHNVDIIQLTITPDDMYTCVLKTHWLRLVQRHWRKVYANKIQTIRQRMNLKSIRYFETYGKYPDHCMILPKMTGMLACYKK